MENEVTQGSNGQIINKTRWASDDPIEKVLDNQYLDLASQHLNRVHELEDENKWLKRINKDFENKSYELWIKNKNLENLADENKTLKFQLQELHQANVNLFNESEKLKRELEINNFKKTSLDSQLYTENIHLKERCESQSNDITELTKSWKSATESLNYNLKEKELIENKIEDLQEELDNYKNKTNLISDLDNQYFLQAKKHLDRVHELEDLNSKLFNKNQELERKNKYISNEEIQRLNSVIRNYEYAYKNTTEIYSLALEKDSLRNEIRKLNEQLELKETVNQDLAKKYQLLEEEIQAYDINMLELVEDYKKLEKELEIYKNPETLRNQIIEKIINKLDNFKYSGLKRIEINIFPRG